MLSLAMTICTATLLGAAPSAEPPRIPELKFEKYTLANGLDVILHEDHSTPIVGINVWYHVGSKNERPGRTGFAHLFEHMMFQGSKHYDKVYFGPLQTVGGRLNGSTNMDRTNYWETVPSNYLELALWMESDRMGYLLPAMSQAKLDNQRDVVKNERRQSYENRPYGLVFETILAALCPADHPYSWPTIGSMKDITAASREDIADFFRRFYHPGNASLCIAGDFDPAEAKRLVEKYFGGLPAGPKVEQPKPSVPVLKVEKRIQMTDRVGLARLYLVWPSIEQYTQDDATLDVLGHVLAGGKTSRLYRSLVHEKQIAQDVQAMQNGQELSGLFMVVATARPGHGLDELEKAAAAEILRIQSEPPTADEIARAVNSFESHFIRSLESVSEFGGRADRLNMYNVMTGDPGYMAKDFGRYVKVDPQAVQQAAKKYLGAGRLVLEVLPGKELAIQPDPREPAAAARDAMAKNLPASPPFPKDTAEDPNRGSLPQGAKEPAFHLPPIQRGKLSNGMEVLLVEDHELPLVNLHAVFPVGRAADPTGKPGLVDIMTSVWDEGTERRGSEAIAEELAGMGASLSVGADWDTTTVRLFTLKRQLGKALDVYADVLRNPTFPQDELERQRAMTLGRLVQVRNEPNALASLAASQLLYGLEHPYGQSPFGNATSLKSMKREDLKQFHRACIRPEGAGMIAVGDITMAELTAELEKVLGTWKAQGQAPSAVAFPPVPEPKPTSIVLIDKPDAAQSVIQIALAGAERKSPDYFKLAVMNAVLGGQFSSRLNMNLRETKGYTYGARSSFDWRVQQAGPFSAGASVGTAVTAPALVEFLKELEGMTERPVDAKELDFCQKYMVRGYTAGFETPSQLANQLETLHSFHLPDDYFNTFVPEISAVKCDDVLSVAKKYLGLERLVIVIVGDRKVIEPELKKLPAGKNLAVFQFDPDFRLVPAK